MVKSLHLDVGFTWHDLQLFRRAFAGVRDLTLCSAAVKGIETTPRPDPLGRTKTSFIGRIPRLLPGIGHPENVLINARFRKSLFHHMILTIIELIFELHGLVLFLLVTTAHLLLLNQIDLSNGHLFRNLKILIIISSTASGKIVCETY